MGNIDRIYCIATERAPRSERALCLSSPAPRSRFWTMQTQRLTSSLRPLRKATDRQQTLTACLQAAGLEMSQAEGRTIVIYT